MTINDAIVSVDKVKENTVDLADKIHWISSVDKRVYREIVSTHDGAAIDSFDGYSSDASSDTELLIPDEFADAYTYFICSMIDYQNNDIARYNNGAVMYNQRYDEYAAYYHRNHMPLQTPWKDW